MAMVISQEHRGWQSSSTPAGVCLSDKYEVLKEIGDGSFGSVALARVRTGGSHIAKRNTMVAIKTMKKTFDSFESCLELREVIFLRSLQAHRHLVPALDIFLDPLSKKLHIAMEHMDGNLYQLMKARDHKLFDSGSVKSILCQILSGLEHIHDSNFFHRDIKPENILVTVSSGDVSGAFRRYSQLVTPPSTPPSYIVKIADFGLAREVHSKVPFTTYVSTRWYRAPEVLLRAGEYSAPVDIWAVGAMAVEIATLKPLFPGSNEVDQVWRVCEIMGSPGNWVTRDNERVGGGKWSDGQKLAQRLGFAFPKMMPHGMDAILPTPQWPPSFRQFVTQCLIWDPKNRPTTAECLKHEYFSDAYDPIPRPKSAAMLANRRRSELGHAQPNRSIDSTPSLTNKTSSWFRKSLIARESAPAVPQHIPEPQTVPTPVRIAAFPGPTPVVKARPAAMKRNTWTTTTTTTMQGAPLMILPSIKPLTPLSNAVTARAHPIESQNGDARTASKMGRQLSLAATADQYQDQNRLEAERALIGSNRPVSPPSSHKEGFFSHLRKRARRLSGRQPLPLSPGQHDLEANPGCAPWSPGGRGPVRDESPHHRSGGLSEAPDMDKMLGNFRAGSTTPAGGHPYPTAPAPAVQPMMSHPALKRHHSLSQVQQQQQHQARHSSNVAMSRVRRPQKPLLPADRYGTLDEQEELLDEVIARAGAAHARLGIEHMHNTGHSMPAAPKVLQRSRSDMAMDVPYPTPSPSGHRNCAALDTGFSQTQARSQPIEIRQSKARVDLSQPFPTPPDEDQNWAAAAAASILASSELWR